MRFSRWAVAVLALAGCDGTRESIHGRAGDGDAPERCDHGCCVTSDDCDDLADVAAGTVTGKVRGLARGRAATVMLGNDRYLASQVVTDGQGYAFSGVPLGRYFVKVSGAGHRTPATREIAIAADGQASVIDFETAPLPSGAFTFHWEEDASRAGHEETAAVVNPPVVEFLEQPVVAADLAAADTMLHDYNVILSDEGVPWNQEAAYRVLETMKTIPQPSAASADPGSLKPSKWILTNDALADDIEVVHAAAGDTVTLSAATLVYATPKLVMIDGLKGTFFSKRLHHALTRYVTNNGQDLAAVERILGERFGCTTNVPSYAALTAPTTAEDAGSFGAFHPEELVQIINMFEEMPGGYHAAPGLRYLVRRNDGMTNPWNGAAPAIAWALPASFPDGGYIEFMDMAFTADAGSVHRLLIHEKAHFLWGYLFSEELKAGWIEIGGWYQDAGDPDGWSTTKTTEFVSAYAHKKNPDEDLAESLAYFILEPDALKSRAAAKYEFIRDRIMNGNLYVSKIQEDLTFEVLNLYPDYTYPGKVRRVDVTAAGAPGEDKVVTVEIELHTAGGLFEGAELAWLRIFSDLGTYKDLTLTPVDASGAVLRGSVTLSKYAKAGFWRTDQIAITDKVGNMRLSGVHDYGFRLHVDNPLEDVTAPEYVPGSLSLSLSDDEVIENGVTHAVQRVHLDFQVTENHVEQAGPSVNAALTNPALPSAYGLAGWGFVDPITSKASVDFYVTEFFSPGEYGVPQLTMFDAAGNQRAQAFSASPLHQPLVSVSIVTANPDTLPPEVALNDDAALGLHKILVSAAPTSPDAPNGETLVKIAYQARDDRSGLGYVRYELVDPQGLLHGDYHYHPNFHTMFFDGDAAAWAEYEIDVVLPPGSAPGLWGLKRLEVRDKAGNTQVHDFSEIVAFEVE